MNLEEHNLREIEGLRQRGQTLSIVDLIKANTLDVDMAAYALYAIANGASFLTAARPGNAGKTTLMACLLTFLPPGVRIITISRPAVLTEANRFIDDEGADRLCFLCHEIGHGHVYGYLGGKYVGQFLHLMNAGCRIASCIHADTTLEMRDMLVSRELGVSEEDFSLLNLILFIKLERMMTGYRRRVAAFYENGGESGEHSLLFTWEPGADTFRQHRRFESHVTDELQRCSSFIESLVVSGKTHFWWVRERVVEFYLERIWWNNGYSRKADKNR